MNMSDDNNGPLMMAFTDAIVLECNNGGFTGLEGAISFVCEGNGDELKIIVSRSLLDNAKGPEFVDEMAESLKEYMNMRLKETVN